MPTLVASWRKHGNSRKTSTSTSLTMLKPLLMWITTNYRKFLEVPDHLTCLLRNLFAGQEAIVITGHRIIHWFKIEKGVTRLYIVTCLLNFYAEYIMQNAELDDSEAGNKIAGRNINSLRYADDTTLMAESEGKLKNLWMRVKEESENLA